MYEKVHQQERPKQWPPVKVLAPLLRLIYTFRIGGNIARHCSQLMDDQFKRMQGERYAEEKLFENRRILSRHL